MASFLLKRLGGTWSPCLHRAASLTVGTGLQVNAAHGNGMRGVCAVESMDVPCPFPFSADWNSRRLELRNEVS